MEIILLLLLLSAQTENTHITSVSDIHGYVQIFGGYGTNYKASYEVEREVITYIPITQPILDSSTLQGQLAVANVNEIASIINTSTERIIARGEYKILNNFQPKHYPIKMQRVEYLVIKGLNKWKKKGYAKIGKRKGETIPWSEYEISDETVEYINRLMLVKAIEIDVEIIPPKQKSNWDFGHRIGIYKTWDYEH